MLSLQQALVEGNKSAGVDIDLMLETVHRCSIIVQDLKDGEQDAFFKTTLSSLAGSLSAHTAILSNKIQTLNQDQHIYCSHNDMDTQPPQTLKPVSQSLRSVSGACRKGRLERDATSEPKIRCKEENETVGENHHGDRHTIIESTILSGGDVHFDDVVGLKESKQSLYDAIIMPLVFPHLFSGGRRPWQRILLYGPPGTGKSRLAKALSTEVKAVFYCVSSTDLMSSWVGESEKLIKELFHHANNQEGQVVIFIDEIDSLCRHRSSREDEGTRRIKTELLIQMDGADQCPNPKILLLCATNCPWDLDTAFLRRFQKRIYIPLPNHSSRLEMMKLHSKNNPVSLSAEEWNTLATQTDGYSGSDLSTLTLGALLQPIRDLQTANYWEKTQDGKWKPCKEEQIKKNIKAKISDLPPDEICAREVNLQDFLMCLKSHRPTVSRNELQRFEEFTSCFGQIG